MKTSPHNLIAIELSRLLARFKLEQRGNLFAGSFHYVPVPHSMPCFPIPVAAPISGTRLSSRQWHSFKKKLDDRSFPYMGNLPVVGLNHSDEKQIDFLVDRSIDEVVRDFLWNCQVEKYKITVDTDAVFWPRSPELISLASLTQNSMTSESVIVYPDTPFSTEEERLLRRSITSQVRLVSMME